MIPFISKKTALNTVAILALCFTQIPAATAQTANAPCGENLPLSGKITFDGQSFSILVGVRWGKGVLTLNDGQEI